MHSAKGLPVLLRNASVGWPVHGDAFEAERLVRLLRQLPPAPLVIVRQGRKRGGASTVLSKVRTHAAVPTGATPRAVRCSPSQSSLTTAVRIR